jgi:hypothetical protein
MVLVAASVGLTDAAPAPEKAKAKGKAVEYKVYNSYFESNKSGLKGEASYLAFKEQGAFDNVLRPAPPNIGKKRTYLPKDVFDSKLVAVAIKRGNQAFTYEVEKVTADKGTLYLQYKAKGGEATTATFASPLVVAVNKGKIKTVVFIENGEKAGTAKLGK